MILNSTHSPRPGQSPACYIRELARDNGFGSVPQLVNQFFDRAGFEMEELTRSQFSFLTGRSDSRYENLELTRTSEKGVQHHHYGAICLPSYHLRKGEWHCPHCLNDRRYMLAKWKIGWLPFCTTHRCALIKADINVTNALFFERQIPMQRSSANDALFDDNLIDLQIRLEQWLVREATYDQTSSNSIVDFIDSYLVRGLGLSSAIELRARKRRYTLRYYPFNSLEALNFLECLWVQEAA